MVPNSKLALQLTLTANINSSKSRWLSPLVSKAARICFKCQLLTRPYITLASRQVAAKLGEAVEELGSAKLAVSISVHCPEVATETSDDASATSIHSHADMVQVYRHSLVRHTYVTQLRCS